MRKLLYFGAPICLFLIAIIVFRIYFNYVYVDFKQPLNSIQLTQFLKDNEIFPQNGHDASVKVNNMYYDLYAFAEEFNKNARVVESAQYPISVKAIKSIFDLRVSTWKIE